VISSDVGSVKRHVHRSGRRSRLSKAEESAEAAGLIVATIPLSNSNAQSPCRSITTVSPTKHLFGHEWEASVQHQVSPRVAVNGGYYFRYLGNQLVTNNTLLTPGSVSGPFCITAPASPHLAAALLQRDDLGEIAPGKKADIVAMRGNPLIDIVATTNVDFLMKAGRVYGNQSLDVLG
jgi:hypothetical protein